MPVLSKVARLRQPYLGVIALSDDESDDDFLEVTLDDFLGSLRIARLQYTLEHREGIIRTLFSDAMQKVGNNETLFSDQAAIDLREEIKTVFAQQKATIHEICLLKEHLRAFASKKCTGYEPVCVNLKKTLTCRCKEALGRDEKLVKLITTHERLGDDEFVLDDLDGFEIISNGESIEDDCRAVLNFHDDILEDDGNNVTWPPNKPPFDEPVRHKLSAGKTGSFSRRVTIGNLPEFITATQILKGVRGWGGVRGIIVCPPGRLTNGKTNAIIEFKWASSAKVYETRAKTTPLRFLDANGTEHVSTVELINTRSYPVRGKQPGQSDVSLWASGRVLEFPQFPREGIWAFLEHIGLTKIIDVSFEQPKGTTERCIEGRMNHGTLTIEFTCVYRASHTRSSVEEGSIPYYHVSGDKIQDTYCKSDLHSKSLWEADRARGIGIPHVPIDHIALKWDVHPFNFIYYKTTNDYHVPTLAKPAYPVANSPTGALEQSLYFNKTHAAINQDSMRMFAGKMYVIVGCTTRVFLPNSTWAIATDDELKHLSEKTLHEPEWARFWDLWFWNNQTINIRKLESYSKIAKHRREVTGKKGFHGKSICNCPSCNIKNSPIAVEIQEWLARGKRQVLNTNND
ncbi:hypothetical protein B0T10DRAFT_603474 [Thelonectria olida]|uniref:RRM domain-containing protein n=1 Tax=Thelonectria olida TaxID=1576542 RepID=A0A9P8WEZ0_9HYPO|nr:hypothetical protein B0T10DRAFT_603474 [Thelonectria olida]